MATPYRQPIHPGDTGSDVLAVRRALRVLGHDLPAQGKTAGPEFVKAIERVQSNHGLQQAGIYDEHVHAIVAPHFDAYGTKLYTEAKLRSQYVNPFAKSTSVVAGRVDEGVDYHGVGPIVAIGNAKIIGLGGSGWPGGQYLLYQLVDGPHAGRYVYVAEAIEPSVKAGQTVRAGDVICTFGPKAAPNQFPGIETGWGSSVVGNALAHGEYNEGDVTDAGKAFARLLHRLGAPVSTWDAGPEYPA
jgi:peptidoglycan hydrolase-like protein with peptidoglycan-binding domain